jgi:uncharacterized membrane protein YeiH
MDLSQRNLVSDFLVSLDLVGTFVFALSGAVAGVNHKLDMFGVLVLSFAAASAGGIIRDILIGAVPPAAITDWRYITVSVIAGLITFFRYPLVTRMKSPVQIFDAVGLGLFAIVGSGKAITYHLGPVAAVLMGVLSGIGGGLLRDVLLSEVPVVFTAELYAVAALVGSTVVVVGNMIFPRSVPPAVIGGALCVILRLIAIRKGWKLPVARRPD